MANFKTHLSIASIVSGVTAAFAVNIQLIDMIDAPWLIFLGTIGGLLPDIDSDHSKPAKSIFLLLAVFSTLTVISGISMSYGITNILSTEYTNCPLSSLEASSLQSALTNECIPYSLALIALATFVLVRYPLFALFKSMTVHRGVFHSLLAAIFFILLATSISYYGLRQDNKFAWSSGLFIGIGFIVHLLLDESYSVDLSNAKIKRSFGTALKLWNYNSWPASVFMLLCTLTLYSTVPPATPIIDALLNKNKPDSYLSFNFDSKALFIKSINEFNATKIAK